MSMRPFSSRLHSSPANGSRWAIRGPGFEDIVAEIVDEQRRAGNQGAGEPGAGDHDVIAGDGQRGVPHPPGRVQAETSGSGTEPLLGLLPLPMPRFFARGRRTHLFDAARRPPAAVFALAAHQVGRDAANARPFRPP